MLYLNSVLDEDGHWSQDGQGKCKGRVSNALSAENAVKAFKREDK